MKWSWLLIVVAMFGCISSCIEDDLINDVIPAQLRLTNPVDTIPIGETYQFEVNYFDRSGALDNSVPITWTSSAPDIIEISSAGLASAVAVGSSVIEAKVENGDGSASLSRTVHTKEESIVIDTTTMTSGQRIRTGTIETTSSYVLEGSFTLSESDIENQLTLIINDDYNATTALPGLAVYLSNNPNSIAEAFEIAEVKIFEGAHSYTIENIGLTEYNYLIFYCKPFVVKVGDAEMSDPK